jgi:hypothetical protein
MLILARMPRDLPPVGHLRGLPSPILRRLSSTGYRRLAPCYALLRAALGARKCRERGVVAGGGMRSGERGEKGW